MLSNNVLIRPATTDDLQVVQSFNKQLFEFEHRFNGSYNLEWAYSENGKNYFLTRINTDSGIVTVAEQNSECVGYICGFLDTYSFRTANPIAEIENMFVLEGYRAKGIGRKLVEEFVRDAKRKGARRIRVGVLVQNTTAVGFYKKLGLKDAEVYFEREL